MSLYSDITSDLHRCPGITNVRALRLCGGQHSHGKVRSFYARWWRQHFCVLVWDFSGYSRFLPESRNMHIRLTGDFKSFPGVSEWVLKGWWWTADPSRVKRSDRTTAQTCFLTKFNIGTVPCRCPGSASAATSDSSSVQPLKQMRPSPTVHLLFNMTIPQKQTKTLIKTLFCLQLDLSWSLLLCSQ